MGHSGQTVPPSSRRRPPRRPGPAGDREPGNGDPLSRSGGFAQSTTRDYHRSAIFEGIDCLHPLRRLSPRLTCTAVRHDHPQIAARNPAHQRICRPPGVEWRGEISDHFHPRGAPFQAFSVRPPQAQGCGEFVHEWRGLSRNTGPRTQLHVTLIAGYPGIFPALVPEFHLLAGLTRPVGHQMGRRMELLCAMVSPGTCPTE